MGGAAIDAARRRDRWTVSGEASYADDTATAGGAFTIDAAPVAARHGEGDRSQRAPPGQTDRRARTGRKRPRPADNLGSRADRRRIGAGRIRGAVVGAEHRARWTLTTP